ncbi:ATP-binding protein [Salmonella enterica subsp. enterica serovar Carmel]|nr:ATP-binding protein [Salmonella enterica subsp. enterica serovar Carmel]
MHEYNIKDALLFITKEDAYEILIENNQRTRPDIQSNVQALMQKYPGATTRLVSLSEMQEAVQNEKNSMPRERVIHLRDLGDVSESEKKILNYFEVARELGASDIHFLISESLFKVRMRIFGELQTVDEDQPTLGYSLCATAILSIADVTETSFFPQREQDARLSPQLMRKIGIFGARYSHRPTGDGLIAVMRLIPDDGDKVPTFTQLGFLPEQIRLLNIMLCRPKGKIILSGPTGSGKSTTLRSACRVYLDENPGRHLLTIEDPLEGQILGATQTPIICDKSDEDAVKLAWSRAISSAMRLDPDAIMEGEMRDLVSMMSTTYAAQTGHLVLSTLHTNSALGIPERMITMGMNADLICDAQLLIGMISQRLVPTLCPSCRIPWAKRIPELSDNTRTYLERYCNKESICSTENIWFRNHDGCPDCNRDVIINGRKRGVVGKGLTGRTVIAEVIEPDNRLFHILKTHGKVAARKYWLERMNGISRVDHLLRSINAGLVDPLEANRIIPLDEDERLNIDDV